VLDYFNTLLILSQRIV